MNISKRIDELRKLVEQSKPCKMTITLKSGEQIVTDPASAWRVCDDHMFAGDVTGVTADRPEYVELARLLTALCR